MRRLNRDDQFAGTCARQLPELSKYNNLIVFQVDLLNVYIQIPKSTQLQHAGFLKFVPYVLKYIFEELLVNFRFAILSKVKY